MTPPPLATRFKALGIRCSAPLTIFTLRHLQIADLSVTCGQWVVVRIVYVQISFIPRTVDLVLDLPRRPMVYIIRERVPIGTAEYVAIGLLDFIEEGQLVVKHCLKRVESVYRSCFLAVFGNKEGTIVAVLTPNMDELVQILGDDLICLGVGMNAKPCC